MADKFSIALKKFNKKYVKLNSLDVETVSHGSSDNEKFKRSEKWIKFKIKMEKIDLDLAQIEIDLHNIFCFLLSLMTQDCASNDLISICFDSDDKHIYLNPKPKHVYTAQHVLDLLENDENGPINGNELKFTVISVQAPLRLFKRNIIQH